MKILVRIVSFLTHQFEEETVWACVMSARYRKGFSLVELIVVAGFIAILASVLLPAIQFTREATRRSSCSNNIQQLAFAVQGYELAFRLLPPRGMGWGRANPEAKFTDVSSNSQWSGLVSILPYMDQAPLYRSIDQGFERSLKGVITYEFEDDFEELTQN